MTISQSHHFINFNKSIPIFTIGVNMILKKFIISITDGITNDILMIDNVGNIYIQPLDNKELIINGSENNTDVRIQGISVPDVLFIDASNNNIGIHTQTPSSTYQLDINGNLRATSCDCLSDVRYKKNIRRIDKAVDLVTNLNGVTFNWDVKKYPFKNFIDKPQMGFIAQEVEEVIPYLVSTDENGYKSIIYDKIVALLVEAVKEQKLIIDKQQKEINNIYSILQNINKGNKKT